MPDFGALLSDFTAADPDVREDAVAEYIALISGRKTTKAAITALAEWLESDKEQHPEFLFRAEGVCAKSREPIGNCLLGLSEAVDHQWRVLQDTDSASEQELIEVEQDAQTAGDLAQRRLVMTPADLLEALPRCAPIKRRVQQRIEAFRPGGKHFD